MKYSRIVKLQLLRNKIEEENVELKVGNLALRDPPSSPKDIIAAQAPAIKPPDLLPAIVGDTYRPPDHSVTVTSTNVRSEVWNERTNMLTKATANDKKNKKMQSYKFQF